ncbi:MAG: hypothetical protein KDE15_10180 [Erythrobacter sp.]|nr:hypothetical protein [Erythrobacter sp.]
MALTYEFLMARAEEAATEAREAKLDNVRHKALRSEAAWRDMAERTLKVDEAKERARFEREQDKAREAAARASPPAEESS